MRISDWSSDVCSSDLKLARTFHKDETMKKLSRKALMGLMMAVGILAGPCTYAAGGSIADIKARGELTVGTEAAYEPYEFIKNGQIVGYGKDILNYMTQKLGVKLNQLNLPFQGLLPGVLAHKFYFVATSVGITAQRATRVACTKPIGEVRSLLVVHKANSTIKN